MSLTDPGTALGRGRESRVGSPGPRVARPKSRPESRPESRAVSRGASATSFSSRPFAFTGRQGVRPSATG